jgi:ABC-type transporter Mla maintaining outer membrane lipid asymmetry ATPase subunit MlaF
MSAAIELAGARAETDGGSAGVTLTVETGEFLTLVGPARSGKGVILKLCAGLIEPVEGTVRVLDCELAGLDEEALIDLRMRVGIVLQPPGLLSNMTVYNNVALPLRYHRGLSDEEIRPLVEAELESLGMAALAERFPAQLTPGEARGAAIARAMILGQELLLLDEPTDGMDAGMIKRLGRLLTERRRARRLTIVLTLHDFSSLLECADRVAFVRDGRIEAIGRHAELLATAGEDLKDYLS